MKMKRMLSFVLVLIMVLGVLPGGILNLHRASAVQEQPEPMTLKIDFKDFAIKASKQSWWADLGAGANEMTKYAGSTAYNQEMTAQQTAAYDSLLAWQKENFDWSIDETNSKFKVAGAAKVLHFNSDPGVPWGVAYRSMFQSIVVCC